MSKSNDSSDDDRDLYSGLIRLHVLHHASEEPIFGLGMVEELARHGYRSVQARCIRSCMAWSGKDTCAPRHGAMESRSLRSTALGLRAGKRCESRGARCVNSFRN
jgi:hypothetical protein